MILRSITPSANDEDIINEEMTKMEEELKTVDDREGETKIITLVIPKSFGDRNNVKGKKVDSDINVVPEVSH